MKMEHLKIRPTKISAIIFVLSIALFSNIEINAEERPFGTVKVDEGIYFDETEIVVGTWLSFYTWTLINEGYEAAQQLLPDSNAIEPILWEYIKRGATQPFDRLAPYTLLPIGYFEKQCVAEVKQLGKRVIASRECALIYLPITGVTYEQVVKFCQWRTKMVGNNKYIFRLPTPDEWRDMALKGLNENERIRNIKDSINKNGCPIFNYNTKLTCSSEIEIGALLGVGTFHSDRTGLYDVFGNVSEMTSVKGISKGGNYFLPANRSHVDSVQWYRKAEKWLGFRCIAIMKGRESDDTTGKDSVEAKNYPDNSKSKFGKFTDPRDGKTYPTVRIGDQIWMAKNLAYKPENGKYWVFKNEEQYIAYHGYLYTWETAQNVCPAGWHLPSKEEFEILLQSIGGAGSLAYKNLRPSGNSGLAVIDCSLRYGLNYTLNEGGVAFWSSSEKNKRKAWGLGVSSFNSSVNLYDTYNKNSGLPVRCIKD